MSEIGIIITTRDDIDMFGPSLYSLYRTLEPFEIVVVDSSKDDKVERFCELHNLKVLKKEDYVHLTKSLNAGIRYFLDKEEIKYVVWWHPDCFTVEGKENWLFKMKEYLDEHGDVGRVASSNTRDGIREERPGNELPCMWKREVLEKIWKRDGNVLDEAYKKIGGYEDHDVNKKILELGYKCMIIPQSVVFHKGMGTRSRRDTYLEAIRNAAYFTKKWGQDTPFV